MNMALPPVNQNPKILLVFAMTIQMATIPGVMERLRNWAIRDGCDVALDPSPPPSHTLNSILGKKLDGGHIMYGPLLLL